MLVRPNWEVFKAKFSENPQDNFEWFCYLLFSKEYNQPYGIHRYKNQSGIETDPIKINGEVIGWQSKFYGDSLSNHKEDLIGTLTKTKRDNPNITKIILYTNSEWGQGRNRKEPKAKIDIEGEAKKLNIDLVWRSKSYFESPFVCQEQKDISKYFFELDTKWELTPLGFFDTLKSKYENSFKTISLLANDKKQIDNIFVNLAIIREQKEKKENSKLIKREPILSSYEEIHRPKEPIDIENLINISKKSLIFGRAGIGKTTLCKYISYKWAKGEIYQAFEYIIYIPLREWKNGGLKGAIKDYYYSLDEKELNINFKDYKILFLFDGYDELDNDKKKDLRDEIEKYNLTHYIITTRPYRYQNSDFRVDKYFETIGFTENNINSYIDNFFGVKSQKGELLRKYLQTNINIKQIGYIPLMLEMICLEWDKKEFNNSLTMTELYTQVVEDILNKYSAQKDDTRVYKRKNRKKIKEELGKLAFEGLKKQVIIFDGDFIEKYIDDIFFEENIIYSGFLKSDSKEKDLLDNKFEFIHLTFQEYFSALYVSNLTKEEQSKIIRDWKFYPHMQMFFAFLAGLIEDKEFLLKEIESEPKDLVGVYSVLFTINCLSEIKDAKVEIKWIKIFITKWLCFMIKTEGDYEIFLIKLKSIFHFIDKNDDIIINLKKLSNKNIILNHDIKEFLNFLYQKKSLTFKRNNSEKNNSSATTTLKSEETFIPQEEILDENIFIDIKDIRRNKIYILQKNERIDELFEYLKKGNNNIEIREYIVNALVTLSRTKNITNKLISLINDYKIQFVVKIDIVKILLLIYNRTMENKIIDTIINFINNKKVNNNVRKVIAKLFIKAIYDLSILKKSNIKEHFPEIFILYTSSQNFFKFYDSSYIDLKFLIKHIIYNKLPLYLKNNKLHTIENGKEISTKREVDKEILSKITKIIEEM